VCRNRGTEVKLLERLAHRWKGPSEFVAQVGIGPDTADFSSDGALKLKENA